MKSISNFKFPVIPKSIRKIVYLTLIFTLSLRLLGIFIDPDMWWHIKLGGDILNNKWVNTLTFTCTDYTWINHSWLSDVLLNGINNIAGLHGLSIFFAIIFLGGIIFSCLALKAILKQYQIKSSKLNFLLYILFFILLLSSFIAIRPQVFTFFFFNALIYLLVILYYKKTVNYKKIILFIPFFVLWVNLHGGFVIGIALIGLFLIDSFINFLSLLLTNKFVDAKLLFDKSKFLLILIIVFLLSSLLNPFGLDLWKEIFTLVLGSNNVSFITEWRAINIKDSYNLFYFLLFLAGIVLQVINKGKSSLRLTIVLALGLLSLYSVRYILPVSGIVLLVVFTEANILFDWVYKKILIQDKDIKRVLGLLKYFIIMFIAIAAGISAYLSIKFFISLGDLNNQENHKLYPIEAKNYIEGHKSELGGLNFYNTYVWGGYLEYNLPDFKWIIDGRMPEWHCDGKVKSNIMLDYIEVEKVNKKWKEVLIKYNIKALIIETDGSLANILSADSEWQILHTDKIATIFLKKQL